VIGSESVCERQRVTVTVSLVSIDAFRASVARTVIVVCVREGETVGETEGEKKREEERV